MDGHIERLIAACGLAQFSYRPWSAPEILLARPAPLPEADVPAPATPDDRGAPLPAEAAPAPVVPPVTLPPPAPIVPLPVATAQPPVRLPPPEPLLPRSTTPPRPPATRPPVVLPPPEGAGPLIAIRGGRRDVDRRAPVHVPVVPPAPPSRGPARPAALRRFALLDEIGPTDTTPPREGRPAPPRAPRSP